MNVRQKEPENLEYSFETLSEFLTPTEQFFIRCHFPQPALELTPWRLKVEGEVQRPLEISFEQLRNMPRRKVTAVLECSGNGRAFLVPKAVGVAWESGAVSNAEWTGVPLRVVLQEAGIKPGAVELIFQGADSGTPADEPRKPDPLSYARSLPMAKALEDDVLLAYEMNGQPLPKAHGFPVRLIVPDWYGMAWVKWLTRIVATSQPFHGYFQTFEYAIFQPLHGLPSLAAAGEMEPKAQIARPATREAIPVNSKYRVFGAAWGGSSPVVKVEISSDGGAHWAEALWLAEPVPHAWRFWAYEWNTPGKPGPCTLMARATDASGRIQPKERPAGRLNALVTHILPVEVLLTS